MQIKEASPAAAAAAPLVLIILSRGGIFLSVFFLSLPHFEHEMGRREGKKNMMRQNLIPRVATSFLRLRLLLLVFAFARSFSLDCLSGAKVLLNDGFWI